MADRLVLRADQLMLKGGGGGERFDVAPIAERFETPACAPFRPTADEVSETRRGAAGMKQAQSMGYPVVMNTIEVLATNDAAHRLAAMYADPAFDPCAQAQITAEVPFYGNGHSVEITTESTPSAAQLDVDEVAAYTVTYHPSLDHGYTQDQRIGWTLMRRGRVISTVTTYGGADDDPHHADEPRKSADNLIKLVS